MSADMRTHNGDTKLVNVMGDYGVTGIDRLQAVADFADAEWAFRMHLDGRLCGVREVMVMESSDPAARMLRVLQALKQLHDEEISQEHHHDMGDGNACGHATTGEQTP